MEHKKLSIRRRRIREPAHKKPCTLSPTFSKVIKLTGFAENKGLNEPCGKRIVYREQNRKMM